MNEQKHFYKKKFVVVIMKTLMMLFLKWFKMQQHFNIPINLQFKNVLYSHIYYETILDPIKTTNNLDKLNYNFRWN